MSNHLRAYFLDSAFIRNKDNVNYVAKSYMMVEKICENTGFMDITDIYASDVCLVEHNYGYGDNSTEYMLSDTQVVSLEGRLDEGDFDTDKDKVSDREELGVEEEVNISRLIETYINYNKLNQEEADKHRATPTVKMYNYISNPSLPDSDFDGRNDLRDGRKLDNEYNSINETDNYSNIKIKFNQDYRCYLNDYMWYLGMEHIVDHTNEQVPYMLGNHDTVALLGKVNNLERNVITLVIGENGMMTSILFQNILMKNLKPKNM